MVDTKLWREYVAFVSDNGTPTEIANRVADAGRDWDRSNVYRVLSKGQAPSPGSVAAFAVAYGRNVLEAFIAAGYLELDDVLNGLDRASLDMLTRLGFNVERPEDV